MWNLRGPGMEPLFPALSGWFLSIVPRNKKSLSCIWLFAIPWTIQSMEFSRQEYWRGESFPSPGDLPNPGIKPRSPALQVDSLPAESPGKPTVPRGNSIKDSKSWGSFNFQTPDGVVTLPLMDAVLMVWWWNEGRNEMLETILEMSYRKNLQVDK